MRIRCRAFLWLFLGICAFFARGARGQDAGGPIGGSRVIKSFDFEETRLGNFESRPMFWSKVVGQSFPAYSTGAFDHEVFHPGEAGANTSFKLHSDGGSAAFRYSPDPKNPKEAPYCIPVAPNSDYYIIAFVRTQKLKYARADLAAWFCDEKGGLILDSETHSQPYHIAPTGEDGPPDAWHVLYIHMGTPPATEDQPAKERFLTIQAGLLQPQQQPENENLLGRFALYQQDIEGSAWFDDIVIFQLPRIGITVHKQAGSAAPVGMFGGGEPVQLDLLVSDVRSARAQMPAMPTTSPAASTSAPAATADAPAAQDASVPAARAHHDPLLARLRLEAADGSVVDSAEFSATATPQEAWTHRYSHAPLPAGLYTATLEVFDPSAGAGSAAGAPLVATRQAQFLCLPVSAGTSAAAFPEYGLDATAWDQSADWPNLPVLAGQAGCGLVEVPAWRGEMPEDALSRSDPPFDALLAALERRNIRTIGAFSELPGPIASKLSVDSRGSLLALINADPKLWQAPVSFPLTRYVNRMEYWQLGSPEAPFSGMLPDSGDALSNADSADAGHGLPPVSERSRQLYAKLYPSMSSLLAQPGLLIPWDALFEFNADQFPCALLDLRIPSVIKPSQIPAYVANFQSLGRPLFVELEGLPAKGRRHEDRLADFAQRMVYARTAPHLPEAVLLRVRPHQPDELLLVYRTLARALGQCAFVGQVAPAPQAHAFLFRKPGDSAMVIWSDAASEAGTALDLPLGASPRSTDLLGNPRVLSTDSRTQLTHLTVGAMPQVISGIDPRPLQLTASFSLAVARLPAGAGSIHNEVLLTNPYPELLSGTLRLNLPPRWSADPESFTISLPAGASVRLPLELAYPFTETAGIKNVAAQLRLEPGNQTGLAQIDLSAPVSVGSDLIDMEAFCFMQENGDVLLQQVITNTSASPLNAQAYALVPGFPREQRYIVGLGPRQTTIKRYTFSPGDYASPDSGAKTAASLARVLSGQSATLGVRQSDGQVLLTKTVPLE